MPAPARITVVVSRRRSMRSDPLSAELRRRYWLETMAVLALWVAPNVFGACSDLIWPVTAAPPFTRSMLARLVSAAGVTAVLLYLIWRNGEALSTFGISRPCEIVDTLLGVATWGVVVVAISCLWIVLHAVLGDTTFKAVMLPRAYPRAKFEPGDAAYALLFLGMLASSFQQELVMRGYLIPRFERLLGSTARSVLVTTVLFAAYHAYQGPCGVVQSAVFGLVMAGAFCTFRRIWPLVIAHALFNIVTILQTRWY